jgi:hypothetical protein
MQRNEVACMEEVSYFRLSDRSIMHSRKSCSKKIIVSVIMRVNVLFGMTFMQVITLLSTTVSADCCHRLGVSNLGGSWCAGSFTHILLSNPSNLDGSEPTPFCGRGSKLLVYLTYQIQSAMHSDVIAPVGAAKGLAMSVAAPRALVPRLHKVSPETGAINEPGP